MANPDYSNINERIRLIDEIKSSENIERKRKSLKDFEIYNDNAEKFVKDKLVQQLSANTVQQMPIISNLNIAKAVVNKEATIYIDEPTRIYEDINPKDEIAIKALYSDCAFNSSLAKSNKYYKLRNQTFLQIVPKYQRLKLRVLHSHNIDVVPDEQDPEVAYAYVISTFDKSIYNTNNTSDGVNLRIADSEDYKSNLERYQVTTPTHAFVMNGKAQLIGEYLENPIGMLNFVDISHTKDFEFFIRIGQALTDFTVDFNVSWSDLMYIARMQGYSVGVLSGDPELKPATMFVGPSRLMFLPQNKSNPDSKLEFDFKSPSPNIEGQLKAIEALIGTFLATRGIDAKSLAVANSGNSFSSALEKLLSMIDQFKATKDDFNLYIYVEKQIHKIVTAYLSVLSGTEFLERKYWTTPSVVDSLINVQFKEPTMIETTAEKLDNGQKKIDMGIADRVSVLAGLEGISIEAAEEQIEMIDERRAARLAQPDEETEVADDGAIEAE